MNKQQSLKIPLEPYGIKKYKKPTPFSKEFFRKWKQGMKEITPLQQLHAKMIGHGGAVVGLTMAVVSMIFRLIEEFSWTSLGFIIFLFFIIWLQAFSYLGARQGYNATKKIMKELEDKAVDDILGNNS